MKRLFLVRSYFLSQRLIRMQKCFNFEFLIMHYELFLGVPAIAVGLSALSLLAFVFSSLKKIRCLLSVVCCPKKLAKDAAPIPNA